mgnify:CR=1 FL=1
MDGLSGTTFHDVYFTPIEKHGYMGIETSCSSLIIFIREDIRKKQIDQVKNSFYPTYRKLIFSPNLCERLVIVLSKVKKPSTTDSFYSAINCMVMRVTIDR